MAIKRNLTYLNKDFTEFRNSLINYSRTYFPTTYNDFSPSSPGMMLIEMASYVGDIMSFYLDNQYQETFLQYARQANNVFDLAYMFGYKPKVTGVATADIDFFQRIPASGSNYDPDFRYALIVAANSSIQSNLNNNVSAGTTVYFTRLSLQIVSSHSFEWVGSGNNINTAKPALGGVTIRENEVIKLNGGQVVYTSTDQAGNFRIGDDFSVNQLTGTISGRAAEQNIITTVTPLIIALGK